MERLETRVGTLETRVGHLEMENEHQVMPILLELRSCYTGTYERYSKWSDRIEAMSQEVLILRQVVADHTKKLERLS